jgi:hypothetical protein
MYSTTDSSSYQRGESHLSWAVTDPGNTHLSFPDNSSVTYTTQNSMKSVVKADGMH